MTQGGTWFDPSWVRSTFLPIVDGTYDLGSGSYRFRDGYLARALVIGAASISSDAQSVAGTSPGIFVQVDPSTTGAIALLGKGPHSTGLQMSFMKSRATDGSADTIVASGDQVFAITAYGADGATFRSCVGIRGYVDATPGSADMPGRLEFLTTSDGSGSISRRWYIDSAGRLQQDSTNGGDFVFNVANFLIRSNTSDAADTSTITIASASAQGSTRGAALKLYGNEASGAGGSAYLDSGDASGAFVAIRAQASNGLIDFNVAGASKWQMNSSGEFVYQSTGAVIRTATSDASDNASISIAAGGSAASTRGAYIILYGNEHASAGAANIVGGAVSGGHVSLALSNASASIQFKRSSGNTAWSMDDNGFLQQSSSYGGDINFTKVRTFIGGTPTTTATAAGTTISDALEMTRPWNVITTVAAGTGVKPFSPNIAGVQVVVQNRGANDLKLYPSGAGGSINGITAGNPITLASATKETVVMWALGSDNWIAMRVAAPTS